MTVWMMLEGRRAFAEMTLAIKLTFPLHLIIGATDGVCSVSFTWPVWMWLCIASANSVVNIVPLHAMHSH